MKKIEKSASSPLYERIRNLAQQHKISLAELERSLQFSNGIISTWKFSNPSIDKVKKVANYFNVSIDYLLGNDDSVDPQDQQILATAQLCIAANLVTLTESVEKLTEELAKSNDHGLSETKESIYEDNMYLLDDDN